MAAGMYQDNTGQSSCKSADAGYYSRYNWQDLESHQRLPPQHHLKLNVLLEPINHPQDRHLMMLMLVSL